jgi:hypothetical protein
MDEGEEFEITFNIIKILLKEKEKDMSETQVDGAT